MEPGFWESRNIMWIICKTDKFTWEVSWHCVVYPEYLRITVPYYPTAQLKNNKWNNARVEYKYPSILNGCLDSWLFCIVKKTFLLTNRLCTLRFSICFALPALWEMSRKMTGNIWKSYMCTAVKKWDLSDPRSYEYYRTSIGNETWKKIEEKNAVG